MDHKLTNLVRLRHDSVLRDQLLKREDLNRPTHVSHNAERIGRHLVACTQHKIACVQGVVFSECVDWDHLLLGVLVDGLDGVFGFYEASGSGLV